MTDWGFIQKSRRKVDFAAPAAEDEIVDESEDEYDLDELDAFADTTDEVDVAEMGLRAKPVPPVTDLNSADAEDLRAFLEAERRRKHLFGSDVKEEEDAIQNQVSKVVEREIVDLVSEDELDNWDVDESNVVVFKHGDRDTPSSSGNFRTPTICQAKSESLRRSPRKRSRFSSDSNDLPCQDQPPTVYNNPGELKHTLLLKIKLHR
jgi:hypothetical protein